MDPPSSSNSPASAPPNATPSTESENSVPASPIGTTPAADDDDGETMTEGPSGAFSETRDGNESSQPAVNANPSTSSPGDGNESPQPEANASPSASSPAGIDRPENMAPAAVQDGTDAPAADADEDALAASAGDNNTPSESEELTNIPKATSGNDVEAVPSTSESDQPQSPTTSTDAPSSPSAGPSSSPGREQKRKGAKAADENEEECI